MPGITSGAQADVIADLPRPRQRGQTGGQIGDGLPADGDELGRVDDQ
jgi:hypothetical protein